MKIIPFKMIKYKVMQVIFECEYSQITIIY